MTESFIRWKQWPAPHDMGSAQRCSPVKGRAKASACLEDFVDQGSGLDGAWDVSTATIES